MPITIRPTQMQYKDPTTSQYVPIVAMDTMDITSVSKYGAVGDGITDDSAAIQAAVNANYDVYLESNKTYYIASTITTSHDIHLHGGKNTVIKTKTPSGGVVNNGLFACGTLKTTTTLVDDYISNNLSETDNSTNRFKLTDMTNAEIGDIMVITATDQYYSYNRQYYYLGGTLLISDKDNDYIYTSDALPWDIENTNNVSVKIYSAPTVIIENLHFESDLDSNGSYRYCVSFERCKNSIIRNCSITEMDNGVYIGESINTLVDGITVAMTPGMGESLRDHYGIAVYGSSNTHITRVLSECANSCIDLSGYIPNMNTYITHCNLFGSNRVDGLGMHENAYNTIVTDCVLCGMIGYGPVIVQRCRFVQGRRQNDSNVAISYRGSHIAKYATLTVSDCILEGDNLQISLPHPVPQSPIQSYDHVIGDVRIENCVGGRLVYIPNTSSTILSNTINRLTLINWKDCYEVYHTTAAIKEMYVHNCTFKHTIWMNNHANTFSQTNIDYLHFTNDYPQQDIVGVDGLGYGGTYILGSPTYINFSEDSPAPNNHYTVCGRNIASTYATDYDLGSISASQGSALTRTPNENYTSLLTTNSNNELVFTRTNSYGIYIWLKCFAFIRETSDANISCVVKNTGSTNGSSFRLGVIVIDPTTGNVRSHNQSSAVTATAVGEIITLSKTQIVANSLISIYIQSNNGASGDETTIQDFAALIDTSLPDYKLVEKYSGSSRDGAGLLNAPVGTVNIMSSSYTFKRQFLVNQDTGKGILATDFLPGLMSAADKIKLDGIPVGTDLITTSDVMTGATSSANGTGGLVPAPATTDVNKFLAGDGTYKDGGQPMVILSYGNSTWQDFINAYNNNVIVYCRASSNSNPATGSQTRMAFMAYVNDASSPTNVEFQYYRSMSAHSSSAMGDEVYIYKLTNASGGTWSVTTRPASIKEIKAGTDQKIGVSWSNNVVTLSNTMTAADMPMSSSDATTTKAAIDALNSGKASVHDHPYARSGVLNNNNTVSFNSSMQPGAFFFYYAYQPNGLFIGSDATVQVIFGQNTGLTITKTDNIVTIKNTVGWWIPYCFMA